MRRLLAVLRQPRWAAGAAIVLVVSVGFAAAGFWQLDRLEQRRDRNVSIEAARRQATVEIGFDALPLPEYSAVSASGVWVGEAEVAIPLQSRDGQAGVHLVAPLRIENRVVLVDRGWVPLDNVGEYPRPSGAVEITATVRSSRDGNLTGGSEGGRPIVSQRDPEVVSDLVGVAVADIVVDLVSEKPATVPAPLPPLPVELGEGNHLLYAIQWFSFIGIVVIGYTALLTRQRPSAGERQAGHDPHTG